MLELFLNISMKFCEEAPPLLLIEKKRPDTSRCQKGGGSVAASFLFAQYVFMGYP